MRESLSGIPVSNYSSAWENLTGKSYPPWAILILYLRESLSGIPVSNYSSAYENLTGWSYPLSATLIVSPSGSSVAYPSANGLWLNLTGWRDFELVS